MNGQNNCLTEDEMTEDVVIEAGTVQAEATTK